MKYLITGANGQLGRALKKVLPAKDSFFAERGTLDITDRAQTISKILEVKPSVVIHAAAYTDVDGCEKDKELAYKVNVTGTENVALACQKINALLVYISTDFVFGGKKKTPYKETDMPNPLSYYGRTKLKGEKITRGLPKYLIARTAWLYGDGKNFVKTILNLAKEKKEIKVVDDQYGSPTYAFDLARAIFKLIENCKLQIENCSDIYHITNAGQCSWCEFAEEIVKLKKLKTKIFPILTRDWQKIKPESAKRPPYSVLDASKLKKAGVVLRPWQAALKEYFKTF